MKKKLLITLAALVAVVIIAVVVLALNLGRVVNNRKDDILRQAEARVGREVTVGDIGVALFPSIGVRLDDVSIGDDPAFASDPFVTATRVTVTVRIWPLLRKHVEVKRLILHEPAIAVIRDASGRFNYESMVETAAGPAPSGGTARGSAAALPLVLAFADIEDGTVHFVDATAQIDRTVRDIDFSASNVGLGQEVSFSLRAAVLGDEQDVEVEGGGGPVEAFSGPSSLVGVPVALKAKLGPFDGATLAALAPATEGPSPVEQLGLGDVFLAAEVGGTVDALDVRSLEIKAAIYGSDKPNVTATLAAGPMDLTVTPLPGTIPVTGEWNVGPLDLADVQKSMPPPSGSNPLEMSGPLSASGTFSGASGTTEFSLEADATGATIVADTAFTKPAGVPARATATGTVTPEGATISSLAVTFGPLTATGKGTVSKSDGFAIAVEGKTPLSGWEKMLPALAPMAPQGALAFDARVNGKPAPGSVPDVTGTARVTGAGATLPAMPQPVRDATATVAFTTTTARITGATMSVGKSTLTLDANATRIKPLAATFKASTAEAWRNDFNAPPPDAKPLPRPEVLRDVVVTGTLEEQSPGVVQVSGEVRSAKGTLANIDYTGLQATFRSTPDVVVIEKFSARALDGDVSGKGTFHPQAKPPRFEITTNVQRVNLAEYFRYRSQKLADAIEGRIDLNLSLSGAGQKPEEIVPSLEGSGGAIVIDGALLSTNLANELVSTIQSSPLAPPGFAQQIKAKNPKLFDSNKTVFKNLKSELKIDAGRIRTEGLLLDTGDFKIAGAGWIGFDKSLDLDGSVVLSDKLTTDVVASIKQAKYLVNSNGRLEVPLKLGGDVYNPRYIVDWNALAAQIQRAAVQGSVDDAKEQIQNSVKDFLGGLGKKKEEKPPEDKPAE